MLKYLHDHILEEIEGLCEEAPKDGNAYVRKDGA